MKNKRFVVSSNGENVELVKRSVEFSQITTGINVSESSITLKIDHSSSFDVDNLEWYLVNHLRSDFDLNGIVDSDDLAIICSSWLTNDSDVDLNGDAFVNLSDMSIFALDWLNN